ncbi:MAG: host attachment protein [Pseudomonadota bacterium]
MEQTGITWVVAADGARARIFEERQRAGDMVERPAQAMHQEGHDHPGPHTHQATVHERAGVGRHSAGERAPSQEAEDRFLKRLAEQLGRDAQAGAFDELVILAPPRALGALRTALPRAARDRLTASAPVECVSEEAAAIRKRLRAARAEA